MKRACRLCKNMEDLEKEVIIVIFYSEIEFSILLIGNIVFENK